MIAVAEQLHIEQTTENGCAVLAVSGEIDLASAPMLEGRIQALDAGGPIVVDLSGVTFIDSTGLRVLISANEAANGAGGSLHLVAIDGPVTKLFSITGVEEWLNVHPSRDSATSHG